MPVNPRVVAREVRRAPRVFTAHAEGAVSYTHLDVYKRQAHRITGIAIFFFLLVHILDTAVVRISPEAYNGVLGLYKNPICLLYTSPCTL